MYIAIDIGATKTALAAFTTTNPDSLLKTLEFPTLPTYAEELTELIQTVREISGGAKLEGIGIALAAPLDKDGTINSKSNLPGYIKHNLTSDLTPAFTTNVVSQNDAVCAVLAELMLSSTPPVKRVLHLILGTGFGGAFGQRQASGLMTTLALEPGWTIIHPGGMPHTQCQIKGTVEAYVAGSQIEAQLGINLQALPDNHRIWQQVANYGGMVIYNLVQLFHPEVIVFSGGLIEHRPFLLNDLNAKLEMYREYVSFPPFKLSTFKPNPCLIGALLLLQ